MTRPTPLPWVKSWTSSLTDFDWLALSLEDRAVFTEIVKLGGIAWPRGVVKGTDDAIAAGIRADVTVVTRAINRLASKPHISLRRFSGGVKVVNWERYQVPKMVLSHAQRGDAPHRDKTETETERKTETRVARHALLEGYDGWIDQPNDARELERLAFAYPALDLAEELRGFMAYADRRAGEGNAYVDYIDAFRNRLKAQFEYYKKRGWLGEVSIERDLTPEERRASLRIS